VWLGVGAFVLVGSGAGAGWPLAAEPEPGGVALRAPTTDTATPRMDLGHIVVAQHPDHAATKDAAKDKEAGEGGEGKDIANLPPELAFAVRIALLRGHLLVGDELVKQQQWNAALPHFLHPTEELYGDLKD